MTKVELAENWDRFGQWVVAQRQVANMTQEQLAERVGLDKQQIYRIEKGGSTKRATVVKIAQALNANPEYAISLAFGVVDKKTALNKDDKQAEAARAAKMLKGFLTKTPEIQDQLLAIMQILDSDHPELLEIMTPPIEIIDDTEIMESDVIEVDPGNTPP